VNDLLTSRATAPAKVTGLLLLALAAGSCSETITTSSGPGATPVVDRKAPTPAASADAGIAPRIELQESEFAESERSRDPFRAYVASFVDEARTQMKSQRAVVMEEFSIDDLRLIGIVTGGVEPRAMLVDPRGNGHVIKRGQFVGRAEVVQGEAKGNKAYEINWRVDRVREGDVVLVREDPKNPEIPSSTRVLTLHPEVEKGARLDGL